MMPVSTDQQPTVLVADDDRAILDALALMLEDEGYAVATIATGDVVRAVEQARPALVLLDIRMSGQDGRTICRALRANRLTSHTPVVMISANRDGAAIAADAGADDFIAKPFDIDHLLGTVARFVARAAEG